MTPAIDGADASGFMPGLVDARLLAIIRGADATAAIDAGLALMDEGILFLEVSLNTQDALRVVDTLVRAARGRACIGAGTVLTAEDVAMARRAGAQFIVTPALTESVQIAFDGGIPVIAGALTPTECVSAMSRGASAVKLFPAASGGPEYLSALRCPLPKIPFVPVGGVDAGTAVEYLRRGAVAVGVGSPLLGDATSGGDLAALRERARRYLDSVASVALA